MKRVGTGRWAALISLLPLVGWWLYPLFDLDEGFYAAVVAEMQRRSEWITPFYDGRPWFEKPILLYWAARPCEAIFHGEFGVRLPSVLAALATYGVVAWFGRRRFGEGAGLVSALVLSTSLLFVVVGRMMLVDALFVACLTGAFLAFWESLVGDARWRLVAAGCLGLAVLAKGPVAGALFLIVAGYSFWRERSLRPAFRGSWLAGSAVFVAVVAAWYVPAYLENGRVFVQEFLIQQNLQRFRGGDEAHSVPMPLGLLYYLPVLLVGMAPWALFLPRSWPVRAAEGDPARLQRYLATWAVTVFAFFTLSGTKLPHYILPCFPPLALLVGQTLSDRWGGLSRGRLIGFGVGALVLGVGTTFLFTSYSSAAAGDLQSVLGQIEGEPMPALAMFRLGKQPANLYPPAAKPEVLGLRIGIDETSLPSALFYLQQSGYFDSGKAEWPVLQTDRLAEVVAAHRSMWLISRPGRLTLSEMEWLDRNGYRVEETTDRPNSLVTGYRLTHQP